MALVLCPECKNEISDHSPACPTCGYTASYHGGLTNKNPALAAVLSLIFWGGSGQIYNGQFWRAIGFYFLHFLLAGSMVYAIGSGSDFTLLWALGLIVVDVVAAGDAYGDAKSVNFFLSMPSPFAEAARSQDWEKLVALYDRYLKIRPDDETAKKRRLAAFQQYSLNIQEEENRRNSEMLASQNDLLTRCVCHIAKKDFDAALVLFDRANSAPVSNLEVDKINDLLQRNLHTEAASIESKILHLIATSKIEPAALILDNSPRFFHASRIYATLVEIVTSFKEGRFIRAANQIEKNIENFHHPEGATELCKNIRTHFSKKIEAELNNLEGMLQRSEYVKFTNGCERIPASIVDDERLQIYVMVKELLLSCAEMDKASRHISGYVNVANHALMKGGYGMDILHYFKRKALLQTCRYCRKLFPVIFIGLIGMYLSDFNNSKFLTQILEILIGVSALVWVLSLLLPIVLRRNKQILILSDTFLHLSHSTR